MCTGQRMAWCTAGQRLDYGEYAIILLYWGLKVCVSNNDFYFKTRQKTSVSSFLSNACFGRGRIWNGKAFSSRKGDRTSGRGNNRFLSKTKESQFGTIEKQHEFDFTVAPSKIWKGVDAITLLYKPYQSPISPWSSMRDELRVLRKPGKKKDKGGILIGFGCMSWSGGHLNSVPFCLIQE